MIYIIKDFNQSGSEFDIQDFYFSNIYKIFVFIFEAKIFKFCLLANTIEYSQ